MSGALYTEDSRSQEHCIPRIADRSVGMGEGEGGGVRKMTEGS